LASEEVMIMKMQTLAALIIAITYCVAIVMSAEKATHFDA